MIINFVVIIHKGLSPILKTLYYLLRLGVSLGEFLLFSAVLEHQFFVAKGDRLDVVFQVDFLLQFVLQTLLEVADFLQVHLQLVHFGLERLGLPLELLGLLLLLEHHLLQLAPAVVELAALALERLGLLADLDDGGLAGCDPVSEGPLRLLLLLGELTLQRGHAALVTHVVLNHRTPHRVK